MARFVFTVKQDGVRKTGYLEAADRHAAMKSLANQDMVVTQLTAVQTNRSVIKVSGEELLLFTQQLGAMLKAGIMIRKALEVIASDIDNPGLRQILLELSSGLGAGRTISEMLKEYPSVFSKLYVSLVQAGEAGGSLPLVFIRLGKYIENTLNLKKKIQAQLYYPAIVLIFASLVVIFMFSFGIPIISDVYEGLDAKLPLPTQILINFGNFVFNYWYIVAAVVLGGGFALYKFSTSKSGKFFWHKKFLTMPVLGSLITRLAISRFARTLSTLYASGVPILNAMDLVAGSMGNVVMEDAVIKSIKNLREGDTITEVIGKCEVFTPMAVSMIAAGEETGTLPGMLDQLAEFYETQVDISLKALAGLVEPLIIIVVGLMIGTLIVTMALPFLQLFTALR